MPTTESQRQMRAAKSDALSGAPVSMYEATFMASGCGTSLTTNTFSGMIPALTR